MEKLTASNIVAFISQLDTRISYHYLNSTNKGLIQIVETIKPEGPIRIKRWNAFKNENPDNKKTDSISTEMIWRIANAFLPNQPINFDRVLGASYNTRSVLESLLVHTPHFSVCYPGRIEYKGGNPTIEKGHKHIMWSPGVYHKMGTINYVDTEIIISEVPARDIYYDAIVLPDEHKPQFLDINIQRRHAQIQLALYFIGFQLNYKIWVAQNDKGIIYKNKKLGEYEGVIHSLKDVNLLSSFQEAIRAALLIDCIWFKNGKLMPAVMEIEHSTGVTSGLTRMKNFKDRFPPFPTRYVIVASDEDRDKVIKEANKPQFHDLETRFFPYSAVEELYALCHRRKIKGITAEFLDSYMEPVLQV